MSKKNKKEVEVKAEAVVNEVFVPVSSQEIKGSEFEKISDLKRSFELFATYSREVDLAVSDSLKHLNRVEELLTFIKEAMKPARR